MKVRSIPYLSGLLLLCSLCFRVGVAQARSGEAPLVFLHVTVINPGTSSVEHLEENLGAASLRLTSDEFRQLSEVKP